jgi:hypothetical protein
MTVKRLTDKHPTTQKVQQVFDLMDELGLRFTATHDGRAPFFIVKDEGYEFPSQLELLDLEYGFNHSESGVESLPPIFEYRLIYGRK